MTKRQYRLSTDSQWQSMFGMAVLAFVNTSGSGRKLTFRTLEMAIKSVAGSGSPTSKASLLKTAGATGEIMNESVTRYDSSVAIPSGVVVRRGGGPITSSGVLRSVTVTRTGSTVGTQNTLSTQRSKDRFSGLIHSSKNSNIEPIVVSSGSAIVLMPTLVQSSAPFRVLAEVQVNGKTLSWQYVTSVTPGLSLFSLENTGAATVKLLNLSIQETGTTDTPYFRVVPIGQIKGEDFSDLSRMIQSKVTPMDSTYPTLSALTVYTDVGIVPFGVPENYMSEGTAGSPKGFNYLHTKDFNGPCYKVFFPEMGANRPGAANEDMLGHALGFLNTDIGFLKSGICLNPGEGLAIVASAETAVGVQASFSGWPSIMFSAQIDDEPSSSPFLTLTNLVLGSDIVVLQAGTSNIYQQIDSYSSTSWSWNYDPDLISLVDIGVLKPGYRPLYIRNLSLTTAGASVPVAQSIDLNYS